MLNNISYRGRKLTGAELEFFEKLTAQLVQTAGIRRDVRRTYTLTLNKTGYEHFVRAFLALGGAFTVPEFNPGGGNEKTG